MILDELCLLGDESVLKSALEKYNLNYRIGKPTITDSKFDELYDYYTEKYGRLTLLDASSSHKKTTLPYPAGSLDKIDTIEKWLKGYDGELLISAKLDGISIIKEYGKASTRGDDGITGNDVSSHFTKIKNNITILENSVSRGEVVISWGDFFEKFAPLGYSHPRNTVAGMFNPRSKHIDPEIMKYVEFIEFSTFDKDGHPIPTHNFCSKVVHSSDDVEKECDALFHSVSKKYPCDGIVIYKLAETPSFETNSINPKNARAYKPKKYSQVCESKVISVERQISKYGVLNPVLKIETVFLEGANISSIYVDNESFLCALGIGMGSKIELTRAGGIIPRLVSVNGIQLSFNRKWYTELVKAKPFQEVFSTLSKEYGSGSTEYLYEPPHGIQYHWRGLDLVLDDKNNKTVQVRKLLHFVKTHKCKDLGESTLSFLYDSYGVKTVEELLTFDFNNLAVNDEGYGEKSVANFIKAISSAKTSYEARLMSSLSMFEGLAESKLKLYVDGGLDAKGLGVVAKDTIQKNLPQWTSFKEWYISTGFKIQNQKTEFMEVYCHTKCRIPQDIQDTMAAAGIETTDSYSKRVTVLVVPSLNETSTKTKKALADGVKFMELSEVIAKFSEKGDVFGEQVLF